MQGLPRVSGKGYLLIVEGKTGHVYVFMLQMFTKD